MKKFNEMRIISSISLAEDFEGSEIEVEILTTANQTDPRYGNFKFTKKQLEEITKNFNEDTVGIELAVDLNHDPEHIALAWLKEGSMRVAESTKMDGQFSLFATIHKFTPRGKDMVTTGAVKYFSVEVSRKFEKMVGKVKKTFSNVIRGLALTNRPVIKDMAPTFSEKSLSINSFIMDLSKFLELAETFLAEDKVTKAQITTLKTLAESLEGDDKVKAEEKVEEAEAKVEEEAPAAPAAKEEAPTAEELAEKVLADAKEAGKKTMDLSEVQEIVKQALKPAMQQLNDALATTRGKVLSEQVEALALSEDKNVGIKADAKPKVLAFVKKLSDELAKEYFALHEDILTSVDLSETGSAAAGKKALSDPAKAGAKIQELAEKLVTKDFSLAEALEKVQEENPKLAEAASEVYEG